MNGERNFLIITTIAGFLQKFEMNDVRILQAQGWNIHYASNFYHPVYECDRNYLEQQGIHCHSIYVEKSPLHIICNLRALLQIIEIIRYEHITAIHCHNPMGGVLGRLAHICSHLHPYVIYTAHGFHFYKSAPLKNWMIYYPIELFLANFTNQLVTINHEDQKRAKKFKLSSNGKVYKIPGVGVDMARFHEDVKSREFFRKLLKLEKETFVILSVGELNRNKNHEIVIRALAAINDSLKVNEKLNIFYMICGEGPYRGRLESLIKEKGLEYSVQLCGYQNQIEKYYQCADCFVFPSLREGLGMAAIEAMACGLPLIVSDNRGTREYARKNENALICRADDVIAFKSAILALKNRPKQRLLMGEKSKEIAKQFNVNKTDRIMRKIYLDMERYL